MADRLLGSGGLLVYRRAALLPVIEVAVRFDCAALSAARRPHGANSAWTRLWLRRTASNWRSITSRASGGSIPLMASS